MFENQQRAMLRLCKSWLIMQTTVKILGGLEVTVDFEVCKRDGQDKIIWTIDCINGELCSRSPEWLYTRIENTKGEEQRIINACQAKLEEN